LGNKRPNYYLLIIIVISIFFHSPQLYANSNTESDSINNIVIELFIENNEFIKGQLFEIFVRFKNNGNEKIVIPCSKIWQNVTHNLTNNFSYEFRGTEIVLEPNEEKVFLKSPTIDYTYNEGLTAEYLPWHYWFQGDYEFNVTINTANTVVTSNTIQFLIKPVPENLQEAFNTLGFDLTNINSVDQLTLKNEDNEALFVKYKGTFYEKEFFYKLFLNKYYRFAIENKEGARILRNKAEKLAKEYIAKYPNTHLTKLMLHHIQRGGTKNQMLMEEIVNILKKTNIQDKKVKPNSMLEVIYTEPKYTDISELIK
jgi:DNA-binding ferritin-like protein (Dps family)